MSTTSAFILGLVSFFMGAFYFACCQVNTEKRAVKDGFMKINGKFYIITPLDIGGKKDD